MKHCPVCGEVVKRRVEGKCNNCGTKLELRRGKYLQANFIAPVKDLAMVLEKQLKRVQDNIFPYRIPQHMIVRTNGILEGIWMEIYPVVEKRGITHEQTVIIFELALEELIRGMKPDNVELGLLLWYISGKETNKFKRILTKYVKNKERLVGLNAVVGEDWLD